MYFNFAISTPKNTPETAKQETILELVRGVIYKVEIDFHPGPAGTLHLTVSHGLHQVWPSNPEGNFATDNRNIEFPEYYEILTRPYEMIAHTWNESTNNPHEVILKIALLPRKYVLQKRL